MGDLAGAVRAAGMRFGTYYSGGLDWTFGGPAHHRPGVDVRRHPAVARVPRLRRRPLARAHRALPARRAVERHRLPRRRRPRRAVRRLLRGGARRRGEQPLRLDGPVLRARHCDFVTPEYSTKGDPNRKWESTRGIGTSFGYNREEATTATSPRTSSCACSSTSWPTAATCSSTSAPPATAPSRGSRPSASSPSGGGCGRTAPPSTAPARPRADGTHRRGPGRALHGRADGATLRDRARAPRARPRWSCSTSRCRAARPCTSSATTAR